MARSFPGGFSDANLIPVPLCQSRPKVPGTATPAADPRPPPVGRRPPGRVGAAGRGRPPKPPVHPLTHRQGGSSWRARPSRVALHLPRPHHRSGLNICDRGTRNIDHRPQEPRSRRRDPAVGSSLPASGGHGRKPGTARIAAEERMRLGGE
jgi:hypothetical protein